MGFLEDLKKKLTAPGGEAFSRGRFEAAKPGYLAEKPPPAPGTSDTAPPYLFDAAAAAARKRRRFLWGAVLLVTLLAVAGGSYGAVRWVQLSRTVQKGQVAVTVEGPERLTSGEDASIRVRVENQSRVPWEDVVVELPLPRGFTVKSTAPAPVNLPAGGTPTPPPAAPGFLPDGNGTPPQGPPPPTLVWSLGALAPKASADASVVGRLLGEASTTVQFIARITVAPQNRPQAKVEKTAFAAVTLSEIPVDLTLDVPREATSGTPITVRVTYQNRLAEDLAGARVILETPDGFVLDRTDPPVAGRDTQWDLPPLPPGGQGTLTITGTIAGDPDTVKPFTAKIGFLTPDGEYIAQRTVQRSLSIERAALTLAQSVNGEADLLKVIPGTEVEGAVQYRNTGTAGLREVIVTATFEGTGLDASSVKVTGGFYDDRRKQMTWSAASSPQLRVLRPGDAGELKYKFRILSSRELPAASDADRNFSLRVRTVGDSPDLPTPPGAPKVVVTDQFEILLNTVPTLVLDGFFDDGRAGLPASTGPVPLQVGKETILTLRVRVQNTANEIADAVYQTVLPEGIRWVGKEYHTATNSRVEFNERTKDVTWTIPLLPARAGIALPAPEFAFQVAATPSLNQAGSEVVLTRGHTLEGTDAFTTTRVRAEAEGVTTKVLGDDKAEVVR